MLVNDDFLYLNLPRSASTSFTISCLKRNIKLRHYESYIDKQHLTVDLSMDNETIADKLLHNHEGIHVLDVAFGPNYDIISVDRNKYERWISMWKHCIDEIYKLGDTNSYNIVTKLTENEIFDFDPNVIANRNFVDRDEFIKKFIDKFKLTKENTYLNIIFGILFTPFTHYHNFDKRIKWFDFNKLYELEEWVSDRLKLDFKLEKINSSQHFDCNIKLTDNFMERYDKVFSRFENSKSVKTFL